MALPRLIPLFPLPIVALPGEVIALHIFEERYKAMIALCRGEDGHSQPFGIAFASEAGVAEVGCMVTIERIVTEYPDGRLDLLVLGREAFTISEVYDDQPYFTARVETLEDEDTGVDEDLRTQTHALLLKLGELHDRSAQPALTSSDLTAFGIAAIIELAPELKQRLLELRSENLRLQFLSAAFRALISESATTFVPPGFGAEGQPN
jgi:Lon protease-like protein